MRKLDLSPLQAPEVELTPNYLRIKGHLPYKQWEAMVRTVRQIHKANLAWWGSLLNYGEREYGEMYSQALEESDYTYGSLTVAKSVMARVMPLLEDESLSRLKSLTFGHFQKAASLPDEERREVLEKANRERWRVRDVETEVKRRTTTAKPEKERKAAIDTHGEEEPNRLSEKIADEVLKLRSDLGKAHQVMDHIADLRFWEGLSLLDEELEPLIQRYKGMFPKKENVIDITPSEPKKKSLMYADVKTGENGLHGRCGHGCIYCWVPHLPWPDVRTLYQGDLRLNEKWFAKKVKRSKDAVFVCDCNDPFQEALPDEWIERILAHLRETPENKYQLQTKNPIRFVDFITDLPPRVILATTIETNHDTSKFSQAPRPAERLEAMCRVKSREGMQKKVSIEPVMDFDLDIMVRWLKRLKPDLVWIGEDNHAQKLPEPPAHKVEELIGRLAKMEIQVRVKELDRIMGLERAKQLRRVHGAG